MIKFIIILLISNIIQGQNINELLCKTNQIRKENGLPPVILDERLNSAASSQSEYQNSINKMTHTGKDGDSVANRVSKVNVKWRNVAENVAFNYDTEESVMKGWSDSPGHRANILNRDVNAVGFGKRGVYWTQVFANIEGLNVNNVNNVSCNDEKPIEPIFQQQIPESPNPVITPITPSKPSFNFDLQSLLNQIVDSTKKYFNAAKSKEEEIKSNEENLPIQKTPPIEPIKKRICRLKRRRN